MLGGSTVGLAGCNWLGGGARTTRGDEPALEQPTVNRRFDEVTDLVDLVDCDPTGSSDCAGAIESAAKPGRILKLPDGQFRLDRPVELSSEGAVGLIGSENSTLAPAQGFNGMALTIDAPQALIEGFDIDLSPPETAAGITVAADEWFRVSDITYDGRGDHPGESNPFAFNLALRDPSKSGLARNLTAKNGAAVGHYKGGGGRGGMWIGAANKGTVRVANCHFEEFANNGIYASRTPGDIEVVGGTYRNNNVASIRIGGEGSFARDVSVGVDFSTYDGPRTRFENAFTTRGIVIEQGPKTDSKPPGAVIDGCSITLGDSPASGAGISVWATGRTLEVRDTSIQVDIDGYRGLFRAPQRPLANRPASAFPRWVRFENVDITTTTETATAVQLADAPESQFRGCLLSQEENDGPALELIRSPDTVIDNGTLEVLGTLATLQDVTAIDPERCLFSITGGVHTGSPLTSQQFDEPYQTARSCLELSAIAQTDRDRSVEVLGLSNDKIIYRFGSNE